MILVVDPDYGAAYAWPMPSLGVRFMSTARNVRLFRNGRNQAVRIPRELELPGNEAVIYREGQRLVLEPAQRPSLSRLLAGWDAMDVDWPEVADSPAEPVDLAEA
jgi:antitoxin VapB